MAYLLFGLSISKLLTWHHTLNYTMTFHTRAPSMALPILSPVLGHPTLFSTQFLPNLKDLRLWKKISCNSLPLGINHD